METDEKYAVDLIGPGLKLQKEISPESARRIVNILLGTPSPAQGTIDSSYTNIDAPILQITQTARTLNPTLSLREHIIESKAKKNPEKILSIASYILDMNGAEYLAPDELKPWFPKAGEKEPSNFSRDFKASVQEGWIAEDHQIAGKYYITNKGRNTLENKFTIGKGGADKTPTLKTRKTSPAKENLTANFEFMNGAKGKEFSAKLKEFDMPESHAKRIALFVYIMDKINLANVGVNEIFTCYKLSGQKTPESSLRQAITDTKNKNIWIAFTDWNNIKLHYRGEEMVETELATKAA